MTQATLRAPMAAPSPVQIADRPATPSVAETARVVDRTEDGLLLELAGTVRPGRVALSCLVQPEPGDLALIARTRQGLFVLALLERAGEAPTRLALGPDAEVTAGTLRFTAETLHVQARIGRILLEELTHIGRTVTAHANKIRFIGDTLETLADRLLTQVRRSFRFVSETEQLRAGDIDHRAEQTLTLRGQTAFVTADTLVKVDADQIHMG